MFAWYKNPALTKAKRDSFKLTENYVSAGNILDKNNRIDCVDIVVAVAVSGFLIGGSDPISKILSQSFCVIIIHFTVHVDIAVRNILVQIQFSTYFWADGFVCRAVFEKADKLNSTSGKHTVRKWFDIFLKSNPVVCNPRVA